MSVTIENLSKSYGLLNVICDLSLTFKKGVISVMLGSSGCGKTTTLRCITGLEDPNNGTIAIDGEVMYSSSLGVNIPPERRHLGMVFQSYAIWPHLSVFENVAVPLRARKVDKAQIASRVEKTLDLVGLGGFGDRSATRLSGGQQQRVAIARCIVHQPSLIVLDEPLSNLDAKLRIEMRSELRQLQRRLNATMIFVTHDQEEAMSIGDEIFLFREGRLEQSGSPTDLYRRPATRYAGEFFGRANIFDAAFRVGPDGGRVVTRDGAFSLAVEGAPPSDAFVVMIRPEAWRIGGQAESGLPGTVVDVTFLGDRQDLRIDTPFGTQLVTTLGYLNIAVGDTVSLSAEKSLVRLLQNG